MPLTPTVNSILILAFGMDIIFESAKLEKECNDQKLLVRRHGPIRAKLLRRRLDEIRAADTLEVLRTLPQVRCHELRGNRSGQLSVDLDHPYRLIFESADDPLPLKPDGGLDWKNVKTVNIIEVADTHE
jgi:proteic killer suppression protein